MEYGYARCSTNESKQEINRQPQELKQAGAEEIFLEYKHGDRKIKRQQQILWEESEKVIQKIKGNSPYSISFMKRMIRETDG